MIHRRDTLKTLAGLAALSAPGVGWAQATGFRSNRIAVETRGAGADVVLIPGLASTAEVWSRVVDRIGAGRRLHLVSVRGFGDLAAAGNAEGAVLAGVAVEVRRYLSEARLVRPALIGHSMGGQVALRAAADAGGRVDRVMTVDASPFFPALIAPGATVGDVEPIAQLIYQGIQFLGEDALMSQGRAMGMELGGAADALFGAMGWQGGDRRVLAQSLYEVMTTDLRHRLSDISGPVTVVYGWSADPASPRAEADRLFRAAYASLPRPARFERIEGAEHMVMIDQPTRFSAAVDRFMA